MQSPTLLSGESKSLEYKREFPAGADRKKFLATVIAFANGAGGRIVIGVAGDPPEVVGIAPGTDILRLMDAVTNCIDDSCTPQINHQIYQTTLRGLPVIVAEIFPGQSTPYRLKSAGKAGGTFVRIGNTTRPADETAERELEFHGARRSLDCTQPAGTQALTPQRIRALAALLEAEALQNGTEKNLLDPPAALSAEVLCDWGLIAREADKYFPTYGFELLEGTCRSIPGAYARCGLFLGTSRIAIGDSREFSGPLTGQFHQTQNWLLSKLETRLAVRDSRRLNIPEIPVVAIREMLMNAFCHRSYLCTYDPISVAVFRDRIEISSPGGLPPGMTLEKILSGAMSYRNPGISRALCYAHLIERWASGFVRTFEAMRVWGLPAPRIEETDSSLRITLMRPGAKPYGAAQIDRIANYVPGQSESEEDALAESAHSASRALSERMSKIVALVRDDPAMTVSDMARRLNLTVGQVKFAVKMLRENEIMSRSGTRGGKWILS